MPHSHDFDKIPQLDLSLAHISSTKPELLRQLRHALTSVGFLYVINHGVSQKVIGDLTEALPVLFALPAEAKKEIALCNSPHFLGYSGDGAETTAGKADRREQVEFATELTCTWTEGQPLYERLRGPNQWPSAYPSLRPIVESYIASLTDLGLRFLHLVAEALSLQPDTFLPFLSDQNRLKLVHYPASATGAGSGTEPVQGVGPHKDSSGWWTFLLQASLDVGGLQALNTAGKWIDVPPVPGSLVVNIGQAFEVVTSGVCRATTHRVLSGSRERFSVPFFQGVRWDLTKAEAVGILKSHFDVWEGVDGVQKIVQDEIDSPFLRGKYDTWGESQLRTKVRSHREVGEMFFSEVYEKYSHDDG